MSAKPVKVTSTERIPKCLPFIDGRRMIQLTVETIGHLISYGFDVG
jgi:hypothetical protein